MILEGPRNTTSWGIGIAESFRNTSKALFKRGGYKGIGCNLQNPSDRICQLYEANRNYKLGQADQAGAEALIVAYLCRAGNYRMLFDYGIKPHTFIALRAFPTEWYKHFNRDDIDSLCATSIKNLTSHPRWKEVASFIPDANPVGGQGLQYFLGKKAAHSFNYQKQPSTFIFDILKESEGKIVLTLQEGKYIYGIYHGLFPEIQEWHREQASFLRQTRELRNLFGHPRKFFGPFTDKFFREAISFIPQSTVGTITNMAFCEVQKFIEENDLDWNMLNNKHDSIMLEAPEDETMIAAEILQASLKKDLVSLRGEHFKMRSAVSIGRNWGHHSNTNPEGLKEIKL
jgi:hypothetical protein